MAAPDPTRLGGIEWLERSNGSLDPAQQRTLRRAAYRALAATTVDRLLLIGGRRSRTPIHLPIPPDSAATRAAAHRCERQTPTVARHSHRTWAFGRALAAVDGIDTLDEELFYIACLLHDAGLETPVAGEDFTIRSAATAAACLETGDTRTDQLRDMVGAHCTPGAQVDIDGEHAVYIQAGATADLVGRRLVDLAATNVERIHDDFPRGDLTDDLIALITAEAQAVPYGRFALLKRLGFTTAIRLSPSRRVL